MPTGRGALCEPLDAHADEIARHSWQPRAGCIVTSRGDIDAHCAWRLAQHLLEAAKDGRDDDGGRMLNAFANKNALQHAPSTNTTTAAAAAGRSGVCVRVGEVGAMEGDTCRAVWMDGREGRAW